MDFLHTTYNNGYEILLKVTITFTANIILQLNSTYVWNSIHIPRTMFE